MGGETALSMPEAQRVMWNPSREHTLVSHDGFVRRYRGRDRAVGSGILEGRVDRALTSLVSSGAERSYGCAVDDQREILNDLRADNIHREVPSSPHVTAGLADVD